jgi:AraC family transcriptional regulator
MSDSGQESRVALIDFRTEIPPEGLSYGERIVQDGFTVTRSLWSPNPGTLISMEQPVVIIHEGEPFDMEWQLSETETLEHRRVVADDIHIGMAVQPVFLRWRARPQSLVIALEQSFIDRVLREASGADNTGLRTRIALRDPILQAMAVAWRKELAQRGANGWLFAESLATALTVHLFHTYGDSPQSIRSAKGGLGTRRLRRVTDFIEAHLAEDIGLRELAAVAQLSPHHFSDAFKTSTGMPPHRYQINRRIRRAKELLLGTDRTITAIALEVGFASHSHFTDQFRKQAGTTPLRFRMDRK